MHHISHNELETIPIKPQPQLEPLLNERQAAKLLGVSPRTLWGLANRGEVAFIRIGKAAKRYDPRELQAFCERNRVNAASANEPEHFPAERPIIYSNQGGQCG